MNTDMYVCARMYVRVYTFFGFGFFSSLFLVYIELLEFYLFTFPLQVYKL